MNKLAKFESHLLKTKEDIAPQNREILQTFVWFCCAISLLLKVYLSLSNLRTLLCNFKALFPVLPTDFP